LNIPRQICPFPAVEYIPLAPAPFFEYGNEKKHNGISVFATLAQFHKETNCLALARCFTEPGAAEWPPDRIILACCGFRPLSVYYRGHEAIIIAQHVPEAIVVAALDSGFFYKELINFEVFLENGAQIARTSWQVPDDVAIRRPPHSKGARSSAPGIGPRS